MNKHLSGMPPFQLNQLFGDFRLLIILFVSLRLMMLIVYQPLVVNGVERGMSAGGDFQTYFQIASLSDTAGLPMRDWWTEFPPLWAYLSVALYKLAPNYGAFSMLLSLLFLVVDTGNLVLIRKIAARLYREDTATTLGWIYALLASPLVFVFWTFEVLVTFCILLSVWWLLRERNGRLAIAIAVGVLIKFTPAVVFGAVWRYRERRRAAVSTLIAVVIVILVYGYFFVQNVSMTLPSLTAQFNKASYQTVWALLDGNYRTGNFGPLEDRLDPDRATVVQGNPPRVPSMMRLGIAVLIGMFVFARTRRFDDKGLVAFVGISLVIFFLQAQGWSPQWLVQIIPFVLLCFPNRDGVLIVILLSLVTFAEYPFLFIRTGDTGGEITGPLITPFVALIAVRTLMLVGVCVAFYRILRQPRNHQGMAV
ncbi:MAG: glycosyltransferase family 87 protein [Anaerolineae bacterium]